jgi:hypothetical protein
MSKQNNRKTELVIPNVEGEINFSYTIRYELPKTFTLKDVISTQENQQLTSRIIYSPLNDWQINEAKKNNCM